MFKTRLISGIVLVLIMFGTLYFGGIPTLLMTAFISVVGVYELMRIPKKNSKLMIVMTEAVTIAFYILLGLGYTFASYQYYYLLLLTIFMIFIMSVYVFSYPAYHFEDVMLPFFFYVAVMLSYIMQVRNLQNGGYFVVLVFLSAWGNDTCAYCAGMLFGKHKMSPRLSPKKSWEGFFGGIIGAAILGIIYAVIYCNLTGENNVSVYVLSFAAICGIGGMISVIGDLAASAIKRQYEIKDYGNLIPGHGGILDRFDSMIMTAPIVYYLVTLFLGM